MMRIVAAVALRLLANAAGLLIAAVVLSGFRVTAAAFVVAVLIFTVVEVVLDPLMIKISLKYAPVLRGGVALVTTFLGLVVTSVVTDGMTIRGLSAWLIGALIVWLGGVLAALLLPLVVFKNTMRRQGRPRS